MTGGDFEAAAQAIRAGKWRENIQAKDWVGCPIAQGAGPRSSRSKADKAKVKGLIKIWIGAGNLVVVEELDEKRMPRKFVQVADAA